MDSQKQSTFQRLWKWNKLGHFRVPPGLCIKTLLTQPLIWKWFFILMQIKLIFTKKKVVHLASVWKWGFLELGSGLLLNAPFWKVVARWNPSEGGDQGGTRNESCFGDLGWRKSRSTKNFERHGKCMWGCFKLLCYSKMRNLSIIRVKGSKTLRIAMESLRRRLASPRRRC